VKKDGLGIFAGRIKAQIFTDSLRSHRWAQMREEFFQREWPRMAANGREFSQIRMSFDEVLKGSAPPSLQYSTTPFDFAALRPMTHDP
jgi:hypothetical protein